uniref:Uncharacterized protein n=1 Tax=Anopheles coluzzii TaxID=1518534 RepID=A0A8W7P2J3_ANOCL
MNLPPNHSIVSGGGLSMINLRFCSGHSYVSGIFSPSALRVLSSPKRSTMRGTSRFGISICTQLPSTAYGVWRFTIEPVTDSATNVTAICCALKVKCRPCRMRSRTASMRNLAAYGASVSSMPVSGKTRDGMFGLSNGFTISEDVEPVDCSSVSFSGASSFTAMLQDEMERDSSSSGSSTSFLTATVSAPLASSLKVKSAFTPARSDPSFSRSSSSWRSVSGNCSNTLLDRAISVISQGPPVAGSFVSRFSIPFPFQRDACSSSSLVTPTICRKSTQPNGVSVRGSWGSSAISMCWMAVLLSLLPSSDRRQGMLSPVQSRLPDWNTYLASDCSRFAGQVGGRSLAAASGDFTSRKISA